MKGQFALALVLVILFVSSNTVRAITCTEAAISLTPCLPFLTSGNASPSASCCLGLAEVNKKASTTENRRALCECFKKSAPSLGVDPEKAKQLPEKCGVKLPVPFDPKIDCSKVPF